MTEFRIVFFACTATERGKLYCEFPTQPDEVLNKKCAFVCSDFNTNQQFDTRIFDHKYLKDETSLLNLVSFIMSEQTECNRRIYSVHSNAVLLPLYRWGFMRNAGNEPANMELVSRNTFDLCEAFFKPTILPLDRRFSFNCSIIQKWFNFDFPILEDQIHNSVLVLQNLCLRL